MNLQSLLGRRVVLTKERGDSADKSNLVTMSPIPYTHMVSDCHDERNDRLRIACEFRTPHQLRQEIARYNLTLNTGDAK